MRALWLADVLRAAGLTVVEHSGWRERGFQPWEPRYGIVHATAAPRSQPDADQVRIVRDGHKSLAGPIANCCVDRTGRWHVLASGRCNTALTGWGGPAAGLGNTNLLGVEACNDNGLHQPPEVWPAGQYEAYARGWAAICRRLGWPASRVVGHKEHQPGDKSDPLFSMGSFRARVAALIKEDDDVDLKDMVELGSWIPKRWPSGGTADGKLQVETILGSGYGHARAANEQSAEAVALAKTATAALAKVQAEQAQLSTQLAGLTAAFQALAAGGTSVDTTAVLTAVGQLADGLGGRIAALEQALSAAEEERDALRARLADAYAPAEG